MDSYYKEYLLKKNSTEKSSVTKWEILQNVRRDLVGEIQAVIEYDEHLHNTSDIVAKQTWEHIKNEELVHVGELLGLLNYLDASQKKYVEEGLKEFNTMLNNQ